MGELNCEARRLWLCTLACARVREPVPSMLELGPQLASNECSLL